MIESIVNIFREQAREHQSIQAFYYGREYEQGNGRERHPLLWLEDPLTGENKDTLFVNSLNFSVLFIPKEGNDVAGLQNRAFAIGLNILERIKQQQYKYKMRLVPGWTYLTLRDYYDNNSCGCRFSADFCQANTQNLCRLEEQFDAYGELHETGENASLQDGRFSAQLPHFDLKAN
jgi:hypothetical protein